MFFVSNFIQNLKNKSYFKKSLADVDKVNLPINPSVPLHIIAVTYNNETLVEHQFQLMRKNIKDKFVLIVADNSPNPEKRKAIKKLCEQHSISYIALPDNPYKMSSRSHAACLNWMYKNYISVIKPNYFGFIDHDVYPIAEHSVVSYLNNQSIYGHYQQREKYWYLWAGLCFFKYEKVKGMNLDFSPGAIGNLQVDTGGCNWNELYSQLDKEKIKFPEHKYVNLREGNVAQSDKMEIIGEWLHSFNGSYWMDVKPKENDLNEYLKKLY